MPRPGYIVISGENEEDLEAYGPFTSLRKADEFAERCNNAAIRPYHSAVVELISVREGWRLLKEEEDDRY